MSGTVVAKDVSAPSNSSESQGGKNYYKEYTVLFGEDVGFEVPVYVNWSGRDVTDGNISIAVGSLKSELKQLRAYNEVFFKLFEDAYETKDRMVFTIDEDLCIEPYVEMTDEREKMKAGLMETEKI